MADGLHCGAGRARLWRALPSDYRARRRKERIDQQRRVQDPERVPGRRRHASAVTEFGRQREQSISDQGVEHLGVLAHELRNALNTATLAFGALQSGAVGTSGSTSGLLSRSLARMRDLLERSLAEVRVNAGIHRRTYVSVAALIDEVTIAAAIDAAHRGLQLTVEPVVDGVMVYADRQILVSVLSNLLQNAFKFTIPLVMCR